jgi:uncharacterized membrane protein YeaQ/YmgE (transglycosylase-associated protein family)
MEFLLLLAIGLAAGVVTRRMVPWAEGEPASIAIAVGVMGSIVGSLLARSLGYGGGGPPTFVASALSALLFVFIYFAATSDRTAP